MTHASAARTTTIIQAVLNGTRIINGYQRHVIEVTEADFPKTEASEVRSQLFKKFLF